MNLQNCKVNNVYIKINYKNYKIIIYGKKERSNIIRQLKSICD